MGRIPPGIPPSGTKAIRRLGPTGEANLSQFSAFLLLAIGVQIVWSGLRELIRGLQPAGWRSAVTRGRAVRIQARSHRYTFA